jgi:hypothetical protein
MIYALCKLDRTKLGDQFKYGFLWTEMVDWMNESQRMTNWKVVYRYDTTDIYLKIKCNKDVLIEFRLVWHESIINIEMANDF